MEEKELCCLSHVNDGSFLSYAVLIYPTGIVPIISMSLLYTKDRCFTDYRGSMYDDVIKWKHLPRCWPFVRIIHRSLVISLTKASYAEL